MDLTRLNELLERVDAGMRLNDKECEEIMKKEEELAQSNDLEDSYLFFEIWLKFFTTQKRFQFLAYQKSLLLTKVESKHIDENTVAYAAVAMKAFEKFFGQRPDTLSSSPGQSMLSIISDQLRNNVTEDNMKNFQFPTIQKLKILNSPIDFPEPDPIVLLWIQDLKLKEKDKKIDDLKKELNAFAEKHSSLEQKVIELTRVIRVVMEPKVTEHDKAIHGLTQRIENQAQETKITVEQGLKENSSSLEFKLNEGVKVLREEKNKDIQGLKQQIEDSTKGVNEVKKEVSTQSGKIKALEDRIAAGFVAAAPPIAAASVLPSYNAQQLPQPSMPSSSQEPQFDAAKSEILGSKTIDKGKTHTLSIKLIKSNNQPAEAVMKLVKVNLTLNGKQIYCQPQQNPATNYLDCNFTVEEIGDVTMVVSIGSKNILGTPLVLAVKAPTKSYASMFPIKIINQAGSSTFDQPFGVCFHDDLIYLTDMDKATVHVFKKDFSYIKPIQQSFNFPRGLAALSNGDIVVVDSGNNQIQIVTPQGELRRKFGNRGYKDGEFNNPRGICLLPNEDFVVCDTDNSRIQIFSPTGEHRQTIGSHGSADGKFKYPLGAAFNPANEELAVSDCDNHRVQFFNLEGQYLGSLGESSNPPTKFKLPSGIAYDPNGNLLVAELGENRIQVFGPDKHLIGTFGKQGNGPGEFATPRGLAIDSEGNIFVSDSRNKRVQVF